MHLYIGIDWSLKKHDAVFMNDAGATVLYLPFPHSADGLAYFDAARQKLGVQPDACVVGIETAHSLLIDFLWDRSYSSIYIIPPSVTKANRSRFSSSGAHDDQRDATVLADTLRTDRSRLHPWAPDTKRTRQLRAQVGLHMFLTRDVVRLSNRLQSLLLRYYPAALVVFSDLTAQITLAFLQAYPTPAAAQALSYTDFVAFAHQHRYPRPKTLPECYRRLQTPQPQATPDTVAVYEKQMQHVAQLLLTVVLAKKTAGDELDTIFADHPDRDLYLSLPGAGAFLAPALAAKLGEERARFPTAASVQTLAGTCPVTEKSGKVVWIHFRWACDHEFRDIAQKWAYSSLRDSAWATTYYSQQMAHGASKSRACRCLANRWLAILWHLWQTKQMYDEAYHLHDVTERMRPRR
jgi:transposase